MGRENTRSPEHAVSVSGKGVTPCVQDASYDRDNAFWMKTKSE